MSIIEDELLSSSVIKDLKKLDFNYVPDELLHREKPLRMISQMFKPILSGVSQNGIIIGPVGTGKTVMAKKFCTSLTNLARKQAKTVEYVHINCRKRPSDTMVLLGILNHFDPRFPDRGFSFQEMLEVLRKQIKKHDAQLIVVLDEADALLQKKNSNIVYSLTRFSDESTKEYTPISLLLISQKNVTNLLDSSSISTFKRSNIIKLDRYTREELVDILKQRVNLAFHIGSVDEECVDLIADIASDWGDARFAIELLWKSGMSADNHHTDMVTPEHVRAAKAETYSVVTETKLRNLDMHQLFTLQSISKNLVKSNAAYVNTGDAEKTYAIICEEHKEKPRSHTMYWNYLKQIESAGFINLKPSGKGQLGTTQMISLPDIPAQVVNKKIDEILTSF